MWVALLRGFTKKGVPRNVVGGSGAWIEMNPKAKGMSYTSQASVQILIKALTSSMGASASGGHAPFWSLGNEHSPCEIPSH